MVITIAFYEGLVERSRVGGGDSPTRYYYHCGPRKLTVSGGTYHALVADYTYRVYYSPRLSRALSAEVLGLSQAPYYGLSDESSEYVTS